MIRILISGISGQMGHAVTHAVSVSEGQFSVLCGVDRYQAPDITCPIYPTFEDVTEDPDVIIDFSLPEMLPSLLRFALRRNIPVVIGTTGLSDKDKKSLYEASERIPVFQTGNMSVGVNLQTELIAKAASALGSDFDVEIIETHHNTKLDSPSGTALMLADTITKARSEDLEYVYGRHFKNHRRTRSEIGIHSVRGGTVVGEHEVRFIGPDEIVEVTHRAFSKQVFARGSLRAASFLMNRSKGFYDMSMLIANEAVATHASALEDQAVFCFSGLHAGDPEAVLSAAANAGINIDMISMVLSADSTISLGFSCPQKGSEKFPLQLPSGLVPVAYENLVKITLEGPGMATTHGVAEHLFTTLFQKDIRVYLITTSESKIEFCVDSFERTNALEQIRSAFGISI